MTSFYENGLGRAPSTTDLTNEAAAMQPGGQTAGAPLGTVANSPEAAAYLATRLA